MRKNLFVVPVAAAIAMLATATVSASVPGSVVSRMKAVGSYTVVLKIGPAEKMSMSGMGGEKMIGGKKARCSMGGSMQMVATRSMGMARCNHHVELHVYRSGKVVHGAHVLIRLYCIKMHMNVWVPIMTMMKPMHPLDFHYGNNVHTRKGLYTVFVTVNRVHGRFNNVYLGS